MRKNIFFMKFVYITTILVLLSVSCRLFIWHRFVMLRMLTEELEIQKHLLRIKEINFIKADENRVMLNTDINNFNGLTDISEVALAALHIGELMRNYGLTETSFNYDSRIEWTDKPGMSLIQTRINCGIIGDFRSGMEFLTALTGERYAYYLTKLRLSSAGMPANQISAGIELLLFSVPASVGDERETITADRLKNYIEDYGYENPFYYDIK